jgi:Rrf2 family cysteine metabolism transcriptional repressor
MLGISTKGHYGLLIMTALAEAPAGQPLSLAHIAEETSISLGYLEQIVSVLKEAGLVESVRGARGGYRLSRTANEISALEIVLATEQEIAPISCSLQPERGVCCERIEHCPTVFVWGRLEQQLTQALGSTTLADLARHDSSAKVQRSGSPTSAQN